MLGGLSLATEPLFSKDPEEIVREFQSQAQEGAPLTLVLYLEKWPPHDRPPERLIFSKDSVTLAGKGDDKAIPFEEAVSEVAMAQLIMRRTAGIALAIQRMMRERGSPPSAAPFMSVPWRESERSGCPSTTMAASWASATMAKAGGMATGRTTRPASWSSLRMLR